MRGTAWSVPVLAVGAAAPAFALSPCAAVPYSAGWTFSSPASGSLSAGSGTNGTNGVTSTYGTGPDKYLSVQDNSGLLLDATVTAVRSLTLLIGTAYTFSFTVASQHAGSNAAASQLQKLDIQLNSTSLARYTTEASIVLASGYTTLATPATGIGTQTVSFTFTPTATVNTLTYLWTLPAKGLFDTGNGDIGISAPTITAAGC